MQGVKYVPRGRYFLNLPQGDIDLKLISQTTHNPKDVHLSDIKTLKELKGVLHPRPVFELFFHFSQKLQHIGHK